MKRSISEQFLYIKENDALFAIPVIQSISFQSPMFGATYKTEETADKKRLFQIQVFETKANTKCLVKIDEENDRQVNIINEITQDELYGIVYDIDSFDSKDAVESFVKNLNEILESEKVEKVTMEAEEKVKADTEGIRKMVSSLLAELAEKARLEAELAVKEKVKADAEGNAKLEAEQPKKARVEGEERLKIESEQADRVIKSFNVTDPCQTKTVFVAAASFDNLLKKGMYRLISSSKYIDCQK